MDIVDLLREQIRSMSKSHIEILKGKNKEIEELRAKIAELEGRKDYEQGTVSILCQ